MKTRGRDRVEATATAEKGRKNIWVDADVHRQLKRMALDQDKSLQDIAEELLRWALKEEKKGTSRKATKSPNSE